MNRIRLLKDNELFHFPFYKIKTAFIHFCITSKRFFKSVKSENFAAQPAHKMFRRILYFSQSLRFS